LYIPNALVDNIAPKGGYTTMVQRSCKRESTQSVSTNKDMVINMRKEAGNSAIG